MGEYLHFFNPELEEYVDLGSARKAGEIQFNGLAKNLITSYVLMKGNRENVVVTFIGDEYDGRYEEFMERRDEWRDATVDVLTYMLEGGWRPGSYREFMVRKFVEADAVSRLTKWLERLYGDDS